MIEIFTEKDAPNKHELDVFTNVEGEEYSEYVIAINKNEIMRLIYYNFTKKNGY